MQEDRYIWFIYQQLRGELSTADEQELKRWLQASEGNRMLADRIATAWRESNDYPNLPPVNLDEEFSVLQKRIRTGSTPSRFRILFSRRILAAAASLLMLVAAVGLWQWFTKAGAQWTTANATSAIRIIDLPDGTRVQLRPGSQLAYPDTKIEGERPVRLEGEAYFDVTENPEAPFRITTADTRVTVLGTQFNVQARHADPTTTVTVESGKVRLDVLDSHAAVELTAGQSGRYHSGSNELRKETSDQLNELAWLRGYLEFRDTKLSEVLGNLENAFDISVELENPALANCRLTGRYNLQNGAEPVFDNLQSFLQIKWDMQGPGTFVVRGGKCPE